MPSYGIPNSTPWPNTWTMPTSLAREKENLKTLTQGLKDKDPVLRYWSVVGLLLLEKDAKPAISALKNALDDQDENWAIYKAGDKTFAEKWMLDTITNDPGNKSVTFSIGWTKAFQFWRVVESPGTNSRKRGCSKASWIEPKPAKEAKPHLV